MIRVNRQKVFDSLDMSNSAMYFNCEGCKHLNTYPDDIGTGYTCDGYESDCQRVDERQDELEEWASDNSEYLNLLEWTE